MTKLASMSKNNLLYIKCTVVLAFHHNWCPLITGLNVVHIKTKMILEIISGAFDSKEISNASFYIPFFLVVHSNGNKQIYSETCYLGINISEKVLSILNHL